MSILFLPQPQPTTCPECGKDEDTVIMCRHCGHEYAEEPRTYFLETFSFVAIVVFIACTLSDWRVNYDDNHDTYIQHVWAMLKYFWNEIILKLF